MTLTKILAAGLLAGSATVALAQDPPPPPPPEEMTPPGSDGPMRMMPPGDMMQPGGRGPHGMRMHPPVPSKGFDLRLDEDVRLHVTCGDEAMADCVAAAGPLIDRLAESAPEGSSGN